MRTWTKFNINHEVRVRLTDYGRELHRLRHENLFGKDVRLPYVPVHEDVQGYSTWQLWDLMDCMAPAMYMGAAPVFEGNVIEFEGIE
jgi:hypothetical protein